MSDVQLQRTPAWFAERLGCATASRVADIVARTKTGYSTSRANYEAELVGERITGHPAPSYSNVAMQWGADVEPQGRAVFAFLQNVEVVEVGFIKHPTIPWSGASPDGLVGDDALVEIKCPYQQAVHLRTLLGQPPDSQYVKQVQYQLAVTKRRLCYLVSFDPRMPTPEMQMHPTVIMRDDKMIAELEKEVTIFLAEVELKVKMLTDKYLTKDAA